MIEDQHVHNKNRKVEKIDKWTKCWNEYENYTANLPNKIKVSNYRGKRNIIKIILTVVCDRSFSLNNLWRDLPLTPNIFSPRKLFILPKNCKLITTSTKSKLTPRIFYIFFYHVYYYFSPQQPPKIPLISQNFWTLIN